MSAVLALEDGQIYHGKSVGATGICVGEIVFNTAMTGYQEIISDPSYAQQIITFTCPHIGNTGINPQDFQSKKIHAAGVVIKSLADTISNWRATSSLQALFQQQNIIAISDVDTRGLTKKIRTQGVMRACIMTGSVDQAEAIKRAKDYPGLDNQNLAQLVSTTEIINLNPTGAVHVVLVDFGVKQNIINCLLNLDCRVTVVPAETSPQQILNLQPHAILLSNGPGDPQACNTIIENIKILLRSNLPIFGICLGHQLLALALGAKTYKMNFGHRGANHPVQGINSEQVLITSQNHGYAVAESSLSTDIEITHRSLFDRSIQGFKHKSLPLFGFQGHPEAAPGPHDANVLFADFLQVVKEYHA